MSGGLLTTFHKAFYVLTSPSIPSLPILLRRPSARTILHREVGAGLMETSISVGLVGTMVISSVILFGGEITSQVNYRVLPGIQGGLSAHTAEGLDQNDSESGPVEENHSSAQSSQPSYSAALKPIGYGGAAQPAGREEFFGNNSEETSDASEGSSSSLRPGDAGYDWSKVDWNTVDWDWAIVAGIVSHPDPDDIMNVHQSPQTSAPTDPFNDTSNYWDVPSFIEPSYEQAYSPQPVYENDYSSVAGSISPPADEYNPEDWLRRQLGDAYDDYYSDNSLVGGSLNPASDPAHPDYIGPLRLESGDGQSGSSWNLEDETALVERLREEALMHELATAANVSPSE